MSTPNNIFFDLDGTLWDFDRNSRETISVLFEEYRHRMEVDADFDHFMTTYHRNNMDLWKMYRENRIDNTTLRTFRWQMTVYELGGTLGPWVAEISKDYVDRCPQMPHLMPSAIEALDYLHGRYPLHIITNGFSETQAVKLRFSGLDKYFERVISCDEIDVKKPHPRIFEYAMTETKADPASSVFIGDSYEADVEGGLNFGIQTIFYNPEGRENPRGAQEIRDLRELLSLF